MNDWDPAIEPEPMKIGPGGLCRVALRGGVLGVLVYGGLAVLLLVRLIEAPLCGLSRPVTPHITQFVCRNALRLMGIALRTQGQPMRQKGALVSNHASWLDIFTLNAPQRVYFVSKSEVASWPGIGWLARATGTVFIRRKGVEAKRQQEVFEARLRAGHKLMFFPEGTSTDGKRVLPFKSTLFAAFFADGLRDDLWIQPVTVSYHGPEGEDPRFYGWWGDMDFGPHFLQALAVRRPGSVDVTFHAPVRVRDFDSRKSLAAYCEAEVRGALIA